MIKTNWSIVVVWLYSFAFVEFVDGQELRIWRNVEDRETKAKYEAFNEDGKVVLQLENGKRHKYPFLMLSRADQIYVARKNGVNIDEKESKTRGTTDDFKEMKKEKWALLIGVNQYDRLPDLNYCDNDVELLRKRFLALGFAPENIIVISDHPSAIAKPTKENIQLWIRRFLNGEIKKNKKGLKVRPIPKFVGPDDLIVIGFSGHGLMIDNKNYFCPANADPGNSESMIDMETVYQDLGRVSTKLRLLLIDACRNVPSETTDAKPFSLSKSINTGLVAISSCSAGQFSLESKQLRQGVFSYYLQVALGGAATDKADSSTGKFDVRLNQVKTFVVDKTSEYVEKVLKSPDPQTPQQLSNVEGNPLLGRLSRHDKINPKLVVDSSMPAGLGSRYEMSWENVQAPELPVGWTSVNEVISELDYCGKKVIKSNRDGKYVINGPNLELKGDFYLDVEFRLFHYIALELVSSDSKKPNFWLVLDTTARGGFGASSFNVLLGENAKDHKSRISMASPEYKFRSILMRLERNGKTYKVIANGDEGRDRVPLFVSEKFGDFKQIKVHLFDTRDRFINVAAGAKELVQLQETKEHTALSKTGLPKGWKIVGLGADGPKRLTTNPGVVEIDGDFVLEAWVQRKGNAAYSFTLSNSKGGLPFRFGFTQFEQNSICESYFPQNDRAKWTVKREDFNNFRVTRKGSAFQLELFNQGVKQSIRSSEHDAFDQLTIDVWSGDIEIPKLQIRPLIK